MKFIVLNQQQAFDLIYKDGEMKDETVFSRIRYFSGSDFGYSQDSVKPFYAFALEGDKIVGVAKAGYYSLSAQNENTWSISFFSIDKNYRGRGLARPMADKLFEHAKMLKKEMSTSSYTVLGKECLQKIFNECAAKHGVKFYDKGPNDSMHDAEWMYVTVNGRKLHKEEV